MACGDAKFDSIPTYPELIYGIINFTSQTVYDNYIVRREPTPEEKSWNYFNYTVNDIILVVLAGTVFTALRHFATKWIFQPLAKMHGLTPENQKKMPESAWRLLFYIGAWTYAFYILILSGRYCFFHQPSIVWDGWNLSADLPLDIYILYVTQSGFYVHSLYATLFLDTWRKDSVVMMIHHVLTVALIFISYSLRYQNIGSLVLFLHDVCDIMLEFTKLNVYFKMQDGKPIKKHELLANVTFFCFAASWFICRLYWYPLKVLYSTTSVVSAKKLILPCAILMNVLLWVLQAMNIYWFMFILGLLIKVLTGQLREVDDTREFDVDEKFSQKLSEKLDSVCGEDTKKLEKMEKNYLTGRCEEDTAMDKGNEVDSHAHIKQRQKRGI